MSISLKNNYVVDVPVAAEDTLSPTPSNDSTFLSLSNKMFSAMPELRHLYLCVQGITEYGWKVLS